MKHKEFRTSSNIIISKQHTGQRQKSIRDFTKPEKYPQVPNAVPGYRLCVYFRRYDNLAASWHWPVPGQLNVFDNTWLFLFIFRLG